MTGRRLEIVVVGSGLGGLTAALRADALGHSVTLVTKGALDESNSRYAQGGIAAAVFDDDSVSLHVSDTLAAGAGMSMLDAVEVLCADGPSRIQDLARWGVRFDRAGAPVDVSSGVADGAAAAGAGALGTVTGWARGLEAAHSRARVLHAGGDATGAAIVRALIDRIHDSRVRVVEHAFVSDLLLAASDERRVVGVSLLAAPDAPGELRADAVVLATGGFGQLYEFTTNPLVATGDGLAAAWRAGAAVSDLEFVQFHPTALAASGSFLVSEAVRGEGAVLLDAGGRRFMAGVDRRAELAPRDIVARGIARTMTRQAGLPVLLDATMLGRATLERRFPTITAATRAVGLDWVSEPIPVTPAAHYSMGGIASDLDGRTSLDGLWAVGEVAATGVHGANRLASNSLLEAAVFGWRAATAIDASVSATLGDVSARDAVRPEASSGAVPERATLQRLMWDAAGVERSGERLASALEWLEDPSSAERSSRVVDANDPAAGIGSANEPAAALESANLRDIARLVLAAALARQESRGAHFRRDFPAADPTMARSTSRTRKVPEHADR